MFQLCFNFVIINIVARFMENSTGIREIRVEREKQGEGGRGGGGERETESWGREKGRNE